MQFLKRYAEEDNLKIAPQKNLLLPCSSTVFMLNSSLFHVKIIFNWSISKACAGWLILWNCSTRLVINKCVHTLCIIKSIKYMYSYILWRPTCLLTRNLRMMNDVSGIVVTDWLDAYFNTPQTTSSPTATTFSEWYWMLFKYVTT